MIEKRKIEKLSKKRESNFWSFELESIENEIELIEFVVSGGGRSRVKKNKSEADVDEYDSIKKLKSTKKTKKEGGQVNMKSVRTRKDRTNKRREEKSSTDSKRNLIEASEQRRKKIKKKRASGCSRAKHTDIEKST